MKKNGKGSKKMKCYFCEKEVSKDGMEIDRVEYIAGEPFCIVCSFRFEKLWYGIKFFIKEEEK